MEQPRGGKAAGRAGVSETQQPLQTMSRAPSTFPEPETSPCRMIQIERSGCCVHGVSNVSTRTENTRAWKLREKQRTKSAQHAVNKTSARSGKTAVLNARRRAPCKVRSGRRRRGVPRLLLWWRCTGSTISGMQNHPSGKRRTRMPNPSLKRSANGRPPGPGRWYGVHFHRPGPGILPSSPA